MSYFDASFLLSASFASCFMSWALVVPLRHRERACIEENKRNLLKRIFRQLMHLFLRLHFIYYHGLCPLPAQDESTNCSCSEFDFDLRPSLASISAGPPLLPTPYLSVFEPTFRYVWAARQNVCDVTNRYYVGRYKCSGPGTECRTEKQNR